MFFLPQRKEATNKMCFELFYFCKCEDNCLQHLVEEVASKWFYLYREVNFNFRLIKPLQ